MAGLLTRVLVPIVLLGTDVMFGLTLQVIFVLAVVTVVAVLRFVLTVLKVVHPSLLPSRVLRKIEMVLIVVVVLLFVGSSVVRIVWILELLKAIETEAGCSRLPLERAFPREGNVVGCGSSSGPSRDGRCSSTSRRTSWCGRSSAWCRLADSLPTMP